MSDNIEQVMDKIAKLMRVADGKANENESAAALQMAQKLADAYNIDMAGVNTDAGARQDDVFAGGLYPYQRNLYQAIAELNHCLYWNRKGLTRGEKYRHRLVGSKVNVMLSKQMAEYLQAAVERITRQEYCHGIAADYFRKDAHVFREGMVDRLIGKMRDQRREEEREAKRKREEEMSRQSHPGYAGNALVTIDDVALRERRANHDFQYGEGSWDRIQAANEESRRKREEAQAAHAEWCKANPEEYAKQLEEEAARQRKYAAEEAKRAARRKAPVRRPSAPSKYDREAYWAGHSRGESVSLNRQVDGTKNGGLLK